MHGWIANEGASLFLPNHWIKWILPVIRMVLEFGMISLWNTEKALDALYSSKAKIIMGNTGQLMMASKGIIVIAPDYIGYGVNKTLFKGSAVLETYQKSTIPLWLGSKSIISKESNGNTERSNTAYIMGASEGGFGTIAVAKALYEIGVNVTAFASTFPIIDMERDFLKIVYRILSGLVEKRYLSWSAMGLIPYSASSPLFDIPPEQSLFTKEGEDILLPILDSGIDWTDASFLIQDGMKSNPSCLEDGTGCPSFFNPVFIEKFREANPGELDGTNLKCPPKFMSNCRNSKKQSVNRIIGSAKFPINICSNRNDEVTPFHDIIESYPNNPNLSYMPTQQQWNQTEEKYGIKFSHMKTSMICLHRFVFELISQRSV